MYMPISLDDSKLREQISAMLRRNAVSEVVIFVEELDKAGSISGGFAQELFDQTKKWGEKGWFEQVWQMHELLAKYIPYGFELLHGLGYRAQMMGDFAKAEEYYNRTLRVHPDYPYSKLQLAALQMMQTNFREGRDLWEARFDAKGENDGPDWRGFPAKRWQGENLEGKRMYLWAEQGVGDVIMLAGFLPCLLAQNPLEIVLAVFPKMVPIFKRSFPSITVESLDNAADRAVSQTLSGLPAAVRLLEKSLPELSQLDMQLFDYAAPMGDLLVYLMPEYVPAENRQAYFTADPARIAGVQNSIKELGPGRCIGISWYSSNKQDGMVRNIPLEQWLPILKIPGCHFFSLQHHVSSKEIESFCDANDCCILNHEFDPIHDIEGLAAIISCMDEVITIDNSNAHLAGALGVSTTLLLPKGHNFRWPVQENGKTLWYDSVRIERQERTMDWLEVIAKVAARFRPAL